MKKGNTITFKDEKIGTIHSIDFDRRIVGIKKKKTTLDIHPTHLICCDFISDKAKEEAIIRFAEGVIQNGMDADGSCRAGRDLLLRRLPRIMSIMEKSPVSDAQQQAIEWVQQLNKGVLPVQGPPGTGKSHTAARMILTLVKAGKKVGVTALSHKVITALLEKVVSCSGKV